MIKPEMKSFLQEMKKTIMIGIVGGSDKVKQEEQMGGDVVELYDYVFSENGLVAYKDGKLIGIESIKKWMGEEKIKRFINFTLRYLADLDIPKKR
jgi:phosphomannomutase